MPEPARSPLDARDVAAPPGAEPPPEVETPTVPLVAPAQRRKDRALPILIVGSLLVHALIFLPSLWHRADEAAPREIPVEVVQEAPKPPAPPPPPPPDARSQTSDPAKDQPKPEPPKPEPPKPERKKSEAKKAEKKPEPPKPEPKKPADPSKPADPARANVAQRMKDLLGAMPAIALPGEDAGGTDAVSYEELVLSKLSKAKKEGRHEGIPGAATVTFRLDDAGGVASVAIIHASGDPALDGEAVAMVRRGAPYPPPPPDAQRDFTITLRFMQLP